MGLFDRNSSKTQQTSNIQEETNVSTDNRIATGGSFQAGNVGGSLSIVNASPGAINLASNVIERNDNLTRDVITGVGTAAVNLVKGNQDFVGDVAEKGFDLAERGFVSQERNLDRSLDFGSKAIDAVQDTGREAVGFLTKLTDNVLTRDTIQKISERTESGLNEALRAVETVGTVGSQENENTRNLSIAAITGIVAVGGIIFIVLKNRSKGR